MRAVRAVGGRRVLERRDNVIKMRSMMRERMKNWRGNETGGDHGC